MRVNEESNSKPGRQGRRRFLWVDGDLSVDVGVLVLFGVPQRGIVSRVYVHRHRVTTPGGQKVAKR